MEEKGGGASEEGKGDTRGRGRGEDKGERVGYIIFMGRGWSRGRVGGMIVWEKGKGGGGGVGLKGGSIKT